MQIDEITAGSEQREDSASFVFTRDVSDQLFSVKMFLL